MENFGLDNLKGKIVHFVGIGGISMSALAQMLLKNGVTVQGSNECENEEVDKLKKKGIKVFIEHKISNLKNVQIVVYSSAIKDDNVELKHAKEKKLILLKRAEVLGMIAEKYKSVISVAGSHGKTTATAMIIEIFKRAQRKPTYHLGGVLNSSKSNFEIGNKKFFITESCEYKDNYLFLKPDLSVILNIDADHLDYFGDIEGVKQSFLKFAGNTKEGGVNIVCIDDRNCAEILKLENTLSFGISKKADIYAKNIKEYKKGYYSFDAVFLGYTLGNVKLNMLGEHNILNALASIMVGLVCAIDFNDIKSAIESFSGVKRRCQRVGEINSATVYHDYAHHPEQIKNMVSVAKRLTQKEGRLFVVFEPHTYSRTKMLYNDFVACFDGVDKLILAPVYSAREKPIEGYDSLKLFNGAKERVNAALVETFAEIIFVLRQEVKKGDVVFVLGAGTIEKLCEMI